MIEHAQLAGLKSPSRSLCLVDPPRAANGSDGFSDLLGDVVAARAKFVSARQAALSQFLHQAQVANKLADKLVRAGVDLPPGVQNYLRSYSAMTDEVVGGISAITQRGIGG